MIKPRKACEKVTKRRPILISWSTSSWSHTFLKRMNFFEIENISRDCWEWSKRKRPSKNLNCLQKVWNKGYFYRIYFVILVKISFACRYDAKFGNKTNQSLANGNVEKRYQPQPPPSKIKTNGNTIKKEFLSVKELFDMLHMQQVGVLIMDCRSTVDFEASQLTYQNCLNVPEEIIHNG